MVVEAMELITIFKEASEGSSAHQSARWCSWGFPRVLSLWFYQHLGDPARILTPSNLWEYQATRERSPSGHEVSKCVLLPSDQNTLKSSWQMIADVIIDLWCAYAILGTWIKQLLDSPRNPMKKTLSSSLFYRKITGQGSNPSSLAWLQIPCSS